MRTSRLALSTLALLAACSGDEDPRPRPNPVSLESIAVTPANAQLAIDESLNFTAKGTYSDDSEQDISSKVSWRSGNDAIASILATGKVTANVAGTVTIRASLEDVVGEATLTVTPPAIVSIALEPSTATLEEGQTEALIARATRADNSVSIVTSSVTWSSNNQAVATVSQGVVTAVSVGTATITATDGATGVSSDDQSTVVTVIAELPTALTVFPDAPTVARGATQQFTATGIFATGPDRDVTTIVSWSSSNTSVAEMTATPGLVRSIGEGISSITATYPNGPNVSATLRVTPPVVVALTMTPTTATIPMGATQSFSVMATFSDGNELDYTNVADWTSSQQTIATVSSSGVVRPVNAGNTTITATDPTTGLNDSASVTVTPATLSSIAVIPPTESIPLGATQQLDAIGLFSDTSSQNLTTTVVWTSNNMNVATVDATGLVTSIGVGTATISARDPGTNVSSDDSGHSGVLEVRPAEVVSILVTPPTSAMVVGTQQQFRATGRFSNGTQQEITNNVVWASSTLSVTLSGTGFATGATPGAATISATDLTTGVSSDDSNESAQVNVSIANLLSIAVTPTSTTVPTGADVPFVAMGTYDNSATVDLTSLVQWSSSNTPVAPISNTANARGVATAMMVGTSSISATELNSGISSDDSNQSATLIVTSAITLVSLAVSPPNAAVDIGDTTAFDAIGTYSDSSIFSMTNAVDWSSSSGAATISNTEGTRGVATGVNIGTTIISSLHTPTGIGSDATGGSASLLVELGIINVDSTWGGPTETVDGTSTLVSVGSITFDSSLFGANPVTTDVEISINFLKTSGSCASPDSGNPYHNETSFRLQDPTGAQVILALNSTWSGSAMSGPVDVRFDQSASAIPSGMPTSGTFLPNDGSLDTFNGLSPVGTWELQAGDSTGGDPLCVNAYTIYITAQ